MKALRKKIHKLIVIGIALTTTACVKNTSWHGYNFDDEKISQIKPRLTTEQQVIELLGSPSAQSQYGQPTFFYIGNELEAVAFFNPKIKNHHVLAVKFTAGHVQEVKHYTDADLHQLQIETERTRIKGNEVGAMEQILGNIGRFSTPKSAR